jgi:hypothetical protein
MFPGEALTTGGCIPIFLFLKDLSTGALESWSSGMISSLIKTIKDYLIGFLLYGQLSYLYSEKRCVDHLFMLGLFGNSIGFPSLFNYYHLRLLPYYMRQLRPWKRRVLKERDFFDQVYD